MSYVSTVLADAPTHFWRCADPGGAILHDIGSSPRQLSQGIAGQSITPYSGVDSQGGAAYLDLNGNANYGDSDLANPTPFSLEAWFWLHKSAAAAQDFLGLSDGTTAVSIGVDATLHPHAFSMAGAIVGAAAVNRQHWHHIVLTQTVGAAILYLDAINVGAIGGLATAFSPNIVLGSAGTAAAPVRFMHGGICEVAIYPVALAAGRVTAHFVAADSVATRPVYKGAGVFSTTTGEVSINSDVLKLIGAQVTTRYQNAP